MVVCVRSTAIIMGKQANIIDSSITQQYVLYGQLPPHL